MNRCNIQFKSVVAIALAACGFAASFAAHAQNGDPSLLITRELPKAALLGRMLVQQPPDVMLNGQPTRLAPGARIRDENNQIAMSGALMGQAFPVKYLLDSSGLVSQAWILTASELQASRKPFSLANFLFGSNATTGPVDDGKTPFDQLPHFPNQ